MLETNSIAPVWGQEPHKTVMLRKDYRLLVFEGLQVDALTDFAIDVYRQETIGQGNDVFQGLSRKIAEEDKLYACDSTSCAVISGDGAIRGIVRYIRKTGEKPLPVEKTFGVNVEEHLPDGCIAFETARLCVAPGESYKVLMTLQATAPELLPENAVFFSTLREDLIPKLERIHYQVIRLGDPVWNVNCFDVPVMFRLPKGDALQAQRRMSLFPRS